MPTEQPEIYSLEYYRRINQLENRHWWHLGMRAIAAALLRSRGSAGEFARVLDAGCGTGAAMSWAREILGARSVVGVDISRDALEFCGSGVGPSQASVLHLPFRSESFDLLLCWDVLQHLPTDGSDVRALVEMRRVLRPGGLLLLRANSRLGMWQQDTDRDADFQRYSLPELVSQLQSAGFGVERATYANALPALYASVKRWFRLRLRPSRDPARLYEGLGIRDTPSQSPGLNRLLLSLLEAEARYLADGKRILPFGHSTLCLAVKPTGIGKGSGNAPISQ